MVQLYSTFVAKVMVVWELILPATRRHAQIWGEGPLALGQNRSKFTGVLVLPFRHFLESYKVGAQLLALSTALM